MSAIVSARAEQVWQLLAAQVRPGPTRSVSLREACGAVLARDVACSADYPPFDRALVDGYAVRSADLAAGPQTLRSLGLVRAGVAGQALSEPGTCLQINTGAPLPAGADAVVMVERSRGDGALVFLDDRPKAGQSVERRAALLRGGDRVAEAGTRLTAGGIAALAGAGITQVTVFAAPRVGIVVTGDELAAPGAALAEGQIHESNGIMIDEYCRAAGAAPVALGVAPDEPAACRALLAAGLREPVLMVTGGMSKGTHDFVPGLLGELGVTWLVDSLFLKPGKPTRIGRGSDGTWVLGLPGNPVSAAVCFLLFGRALLRGLQGGGAGEPTWLRGAIGADLPANGARPMFQPARWYGDGAGASRLQPLQWRGSGDPFGMLHANALLYREEHAPAVWRDEPLRFLPLDAP